MRTQEEKYSAILVAPFGRVGVRCNGEQLESLTFLHPSLRPLSPVDELGREVQKQLDQYYLHSDFCFDLPMQQGQGTAFQNRVWKEISKIERGATKNYGQLAHILKSAPLAVGQACGANPFPLIVPCHRVLAKNGIGGFANARDGWLLEIKRWLLQHEGVA